MGGLRLIKELWDLFFESFGDAFDFDLSVSYESLATFKEYVRAALYFFPWDTAKVIFVIALGMAALRLFFAIARMIFAFITFVVTLVK